MDGGENTSRAGSQRVGKVGRKTGALGYTMGCRDHPGLREPREVEAATLRLGVANG